MIIDWGQVAAGLALAVPSFALGYLAYRRSKKVDAVSEQSGIATETRAGIAQVQSALEALNESLQEDNKSIRDELKYLTVRLDACAVEREGFRVELARLRKRHGENGE